MNILIVDDEISTLEEIEFYVKKYKEFDCCVACKNSVEALEQAEKQPFDIVLLDIDMPVINGLELADRLLNIFPGMKVIFITAYNHYATEAFEVNAIDYVLKPIREERLFKALDRLVGKKVDDHKNKKGNYEIYIQTFGRLVVKVGGEVVKWNRQKSSEIFAYLLENRDVPVHKEKLCDLLWPDLEPKKALANLQTTIYSIRKTFLAYNSQKISIEYSGNSYMLIAKNTYIDAFEFEKEVQKAIDLQDATFLECAIGLYKGEYLSEEGWIWAETKKEALRRKYVFAVQRLKKSSHKE
ncbi:response regulator [Clostridium sp. PL3]|uniref:Response regulator n=1 Tax=Clostridium thailandense TaxID=2794346 RepID=A0A949U138_9CLOT|nr:response regulator [Clostridium thailandense]MBV7274513.1 response regulator [Clostridium thailandense]